ncbi:MAG: ATP-binding cassette domain-containing protein, partial [Planctomycetota bacterium]
GSLRINDCDPSTLGESRLAAFRADNIGFIFQDHHLLPQLNVMENVLIPALASGTPDATTRDRAVDLLRRVGLEERMTHVPAQLSGGERERVAIARALLMQPTLVLADEPTGNLDEKTADQITDLLIELQKQSDTILISVTHSQRLAQRMDASRELREGVLAQ